MGNPVVHFEIAGSDGPALRQFYSDLFGWDVQVQGPEMGNYGVVMWTEGGIGGGIMETTEDMPVRNYVTFYIQVDDLQSALNKISENGGSTVMPPMEVAPEVGSVAMFMDPAHNAIGLYSMPASMNGDMPPKSDAPSCSSLRTRWQRCGSPRGLLLRPVRLADKCRRYGWGNDLPYGRAGARRHRRRNLPAYGGHAPKRSRRRGSGRRPAGVS